VPLGRAVELQAARADGIGYAFAESAERRRDGDARRARLRPAGDRRLDRPRAPASLTAAEN